MSLVGGIGSLSAFSPKKSQLLSGLSAIGGGSWQQVSRVGSAGCDEEEVEAGQGSSPPSAAPSRSAAARSDAIFDAPLLFSGTAAFAPPSSSPPIVVVASAAATACIVEKERERKRRLKGSSSFRQQAKKRGRGRERESPEGGGGGRPKAKSAKSESRDRVFLSSLTLFFQEHSTFQCGAASFLSRLLLCSLFHCAGESESVPTRWWDENERERERESASSPERAREKEREKASGGGIGRPLMSSRARMLSSLALFALEPSLFLSLDARIRFSVSSWIDQWSKWAECQCEMAAIGSESSIFFPSSTVGVAQ